MQVSCWVITLKCRLIWITQDINTVIVGDNATATAPYGTDVRNIKADFSVSAGAELLSIMCHN
jgi:hypothetical protein